MMGVRMMAERCPICGELHTAWVMVHEVQPARGEDVLVGCQFCIHKTDVWVEMGTRVTREMDRLDAEGRHGRA